MKKLKNKAGLTLLEMLVSLLILVFIVVAMGPGMQTAAKLYQESTFESDSAILSGIINNTMGDLLRYAEKIDTKDLEGYALPSTIPFVFTSYDYRIQDGYFYIPTDGTGFLQMKNLRNGSIVDLVNNGAYPNLQISNLTLSFDGHSLVQISYRISSLTDPAKTRDIEHIVRLMNPMS